jgi:glycosyltransferase involved in cell wall biosynthesis
MRRLAGGRNVMLAIGVGTTPPAAGMEWLFATALSRSELDRIRPEFDRGLSSPPRVVYAGRLSPEKGVIHLLQALALLRRDGAQPLPLVRVVGDGPERPRLEAAASALGCEDLVEFVGQLDRNDLSAELGKADFYVHPSLTESYGKSLVDAMAHGLPVLSTAVGAAPVLAGSNGERGWLVSRASAGALAGALRTVLTAAIDWPAMRRRCRLYVEDLTIERWAEQIGCICARRWGMSLIEGKLRP